MYSGDLTPETHADAALEHKLLAQVLTSVPPGPVRPGSASRGRVRSLHPIELSEQQWSEHQIPAGPGHMPEGLGGSAIRRQL